MEIQHTKTYGCSKSSSMREVYSETPAYIKKQGRSEINNLILHLKELEKYEEVKPKVNRKKEIP